MATIPHPVRVQASRICRDITLHVSVTGLRVFRARWWLALRLLRLATWVGGCGLKVDVER
jgi:hypothetical protein